MFYAVLWCSMMFFNVLWCSMMFYDVLWCSMMFYDVLWYSMMFYDVIWCSLMFYDALWCFMMFYDVKSQHGDFLHLMTKAWAAGAGESRRSRVAGGGGLVTWVRRKKRNHIPSQALHCSSLKGREQNGTLVEMETTNFSWKASYNN